MYVPPDGLNVGVAAADVLIVYVALPIALCVYPGATAIASIVCEEFTVIGPVYSVEDVVGPTPFVV